MPIDPRVRAYYRVAWHRLSRQLREQRAGNVCECDGRCGGHEGPCGAVHGEAHPRTGGRVVLACGHLHQDPRDHDPDGLMVFCQSCHARYDRREDQRALRDQIFAEIHGQLRLAL